MIGKKDKAIGKRGETVAADYLVSLGHTIVARNLRVGNKEIDILSEDGEYLVFTEVKSRAADTDPDAPRPAHAVNREKKNNLLAAVERYCRAKHPAFIPRIDVIEVFFRDDGTNEVEYIRAAVTKNDYRPRYKK